MEKKIYESVSFLGLRCGSKNWRCGATPDAEALKESGRSILEVLAALTVMSVISFGGIKGYETLSRKMKINTMSNDIAALVKERQIQAMDKMQNQANIQDKKIGNIPVRIQNGTSQDGDKEPFFWIDIDLEHKEECEEFLYTDAVTPAFITINDSIPGECPGKVRLYFPKDPNDETSGIRTYVNPVDGKTYVCQGDECVQSGNNSHGLACRKGYTANSTKTSCEKITCASGTGFAGDAYRGDFVDYANDGVTRCYCPTDFVLEAGACVRSGSGQCSNHGVFANGSCTCNDGYYGADCSGYNNCSGNGTVDSSGNCTCNDGYYGTYCEGYNNCSGNGRVDSNGTCSCREGYYGTYCEGYNDCSGNGTVDSSGNCTCNDGYYGTYCENETGEYNAVCSGHGTLDWAGRNYWSNYPDICLCDKGYTALPIPVTGCDEELNTICSGNGRSNGCGCLCDPGYCGNFCQNIGSSVCNGGGRYLSFGNNGFSISGYHHGGIGFIGCLCNDGTIQTGYNACATSGEYNACSTGYFQTCGGECIPCDADGSYNAIASECTKCGSQRQMCGSSCILTDSGEYNACSGHGTLDWAGANYWPGYSNSCLCDKGYYGADCSQSRSACYNHGQYSVAGCVCDSGYYGTECYTGGDLCNGNGQYIAFDFDPRNSACLCNDGTIQTGYNACATSGEYDAVCNGHGTLDWPGANHWSSYPGSCLCDAGYARDPLGAQCAANTLSSRTYGQGFGTMEGGYLCYAGYYGAYCENRGNSVCSNNGQYIAMDGRGVACLCNDGTIQDGDPINGNLCATGAYDVCSGHGTLDWPGANHWSQYPNTCLCDQGFVTDSSDQCNYDNSWQGIHGRALGQPYGAYLCDAGYYGSNCSLNKGSSAVCNGNGQYIAYGASSLGCLCDDGTIQEGAYACATSGEYDVCNGHGTLDWPGRNYFSDYPDLCLCDKGYRGGWGMASNRPANGDQCNSSENHCGTHGNYVECGCLCDAGYYGFWCENTDSSICNGKGRHFTLYHGDSHKISGCLCNDDTIQEGYNACATSTDCSGHGTWDDDLGYCVCETGYYGAYCQGEVEELSDTELCHSHGTLSWTGANYFSNYPNLCLCDKGYFGSDDSTQCFYRWNNGNSYGQNLGGDSGAYLCYRGYCGQKCHTQNADVCNGNGRHLRIGNFTGCLCNDGTIHQGNYNCSATAVECYGHGTMIDEGCLCLGGYRGANCENKITCVNGTWAEEGCQCNTGWYGAYCNFDCAGFKDTDGNCYPSCEISSGIATSYDECRRCSNRERYSVSCDFFTKNCSQHRFLCYHYSCPEVHCALTDEACSNYYASGGFRDVNGDCYSCDSQKERITATTGECSKCPNREIVACGHWCLLINRN